MSSIGECIFTHFIYNKKTVCLYNRILLNNKMEWTSGNRNINGSQNHYTEQKKSDNRAQVCASVPMKF